MEEEAEDMEEEMKEEMEEEMEEVDLHDVLRRSYKQFKIIILFIIIN